MPFFNDADLKLYRENATLMETLKKFSNDNAKYGVDDEHARIKNLCKYACFNEQLTIKQLGWARAYARRNNISYEISSTQSADSSTLFAGK